MDKRNGREEKINTVELAVTYECFGKCRHCSAAEKKKPGSIDVNTAVSALKKACEEYPIESIYITGGEPLLYPENTGAVARAAEEIGISRIVLITNGGAWNSESDLDEITDMIKESPFTEVFLSADTFHKEYIPLNKQRDFALKLISKNCKKVFIHPSWVIGRHDGNIFNSETEECVKAFGELGFKSTPGTNIYLEGNASTFLAAYYDSESGNAVKDPVHVCVIEPDGNFYFR